MKITKSVELAKKSFFKSRGISLHRSGLCNNSDIKKKIILKHVVKINAPYVRINFKAEEKEDLCGVELRLISLDRTWISEPVEPNSETLIELDGEHKIKHYLLYVNIPARTKVYIKSLRITPWFNYSMMSEDDFNSDVLVITPMYPSLNNPYSATFVYSRVKKYLEYGIKTDVAVVNSEKRLYSYSFKGSRINKISFDDLRNVIQRGKYKKILVHFLDRQIGNALLACDLDDKELLIYCHGADVDLWNPNIFSKYFENDHMFTQDENNYRKDRLEVLKCFEALDNVKWIFNTNWNYQNTRTVTGLRFNNHEIIPCIIDEDEFSYAERADNQKYEVLVLKKMDNVRQYAVDLAVRIILRLSSEDYFEQMHFTIAGTGDYQKELVSPLRGFDNVTIVDRFYDHDEINGVFQKHGILLAPSRYDTQGVTVGEGAMSGMAVIASTKTGVSDMIPEKIGTFFDNDRLDDAVGIIRDIIKGKKNFSGLGKMFHDAIAKSASKELIIREVDLIKKKTVALNRLISDCSVKKNKIPVLSIVIPAYNAAQYLKNTIKSMVDHDRLDLLEIIVVNDGSTDDTKKEMKRILKEASPAVRNAIVFIDKQNGGHGSTINAGLRVARGKYFRIVDADDRLNSKALKQHLEFLEKTDADIVFTNTIHDYSVESVFRPDHKYDFMEPYIEYPFDELCEKYYGFSGYGPVLSTTSTKTKRLRDIGCRLTEKSFYVDIEYNYFMTEAAMTAVFDPVDLYYYYLGRDGQSLSTESYKRNFDQHLKVMESVIRLLEKNKLSELKYSHFVRVQLHETIFHQYRIALEMFNSFGRFKQVEKILKKYPKYYDDSYLTPGYVRRMRRFGFPYYILRKIIISLRPKLGSIKRIMKSL